MATNYWSDDEVRALRRNFPEHGARWEGWDSLLPGRSVIAIRHKARSLGFYSEEFMYANMPKETSRDPSERYIIKRMKEGIPPTQIDKECKWVPGRTVMILKSMWGRA